MMFLLGEICLTSGADLTDTKPVRPHWNQEEPGATEAVCR
jgi:hypothetical protein